MASPLIAAGFGEHRHHIVAEAVRRQFSRQDDFYRHAALGAAGIDADFARAVGHGFDPAAGRHFGHLLIAARVAGRVRQVEHLASIDLLCDDQRLRVARMRQLDTRRLDAEVARDGLAVIRLRGEPRA